MPRDSPFGLHRNFCGCGERIPIWRWQCEHCENRKRETSDAK